MYRMATDRRVDCEWVLFDECTLQKWGGKMRLCIAMRGLARVVKVFGRYSGEVMPVVCGVWGNRAGCGEVECFRGRHLGIGSVRNFRIEAELGRIGGVSGLYRRPSERECGG